MDKKKTGIWNPGDTVYSHGSPPEFAYLIISGIVNGAKINHAKNHR